MKEQYYFQDRYGKDTARHYNVSELDTFFTHILF